VLRYKKGTAETLANAFSPYPTVSLEDAARICELNLADVQQAVALVSGAPIVTSTGIYNERGGVEAARLLAALADTTGGSFNCYARGANERGLQILEATPSDNGWNTHQMLQAAASGQLKALWLIDVDLFEVGLDRDLVNRALENIEFLVLQSSTRSETFYYASVAIPMALQAECDGSYTNMEGTLQTMKAIIPPIGESKPVWRVFEELSLRIQPRMPYMQAKDVLEAIPAYH
jgi:anaerobic selenocysteine-containing dehydrogenase